MKEIKIGFGMIKLMLPELVQRLEFNYYKEFTINRNGEEQTWEGIRAMCDETTYWIKRRYVRTEEVIYGLQCLGTNIYYDYEITVDGITLEAENAVAYPRYYPTDKIPQGSSSIGVYDFFKAVKELNLTKKGNPRG